MLRRLRSNYAIAARQKSIRRSARPRTCRFESCEPRLALTSYVVHNLVSDQPGVAPITDPNLVNAWGIAVGPVTMWVSSNEKDLSTVYTGDVNGSPFLKNSLEVNIPGGSPTGQVFNSTASDFVVSDGTHSGKALFIFASESGNITGWAPAVPPPPPSTQAQAGFHATDGAIYKGIALASDNGANFLYATDFHNGKIDVLDKNFHLAHLGGNFIDPNLAAGFAPFNIATIGDKLYVTYAKQDDPADAEDDVAGPGHGFIDVFTTDGALVERLVSHGKLNSPWGMALAPAGFGDFSGDLLVGNFGDGHINAYDPNTGALVGTLSASPGHALVTDGLWGLALGNGTTAGDKNTLYFAAGPNDESHGLLGKITINTTAASPVTAMLSGGVLDITSRADNETIHVRFLRATNQIVVQANGQQIASFDAGAVDTIVVQDNGAHDQVVVGPKIDATLTIDGVQDLLFAHPGLDWLL